MSGAGSPQLTVDAQGLRVTIVAGSWHPEITNGMLASATRTLEASGAEVSLIRVAGSFELPVVTQAALVAGADAVVALGVIVRGGTPHFDYICEATTSGLLRVSLDTGKPIGFGVLTLDDEAQGLDRAGLPGSREDKGEEAAIAALQAATVLRDLGRL
jgi:6,7-dimethyl-8-ribityllumazine synthase